MWQSFKTTVVTTHDSGRLPGAEHIGYDHNHTNISETHEIGEKIVTRAIESFQARRGIRVVIPPYEVEAEVGFSVEYVCKRFGSMKPLADAAGISVYDQIKENANAAMYARIAYLDMMTGLGNRTAFQEDTDLDQTYTGPMAYIMVDANNLKKVNDTLGHQKGDELITQITRCLKQVIKNGGKCYRIGGDEFVISLRTKTRQDVENYITQIQNKIQIADAQSSIPISAAIGYAWTAESHKDLEKLLHEADESMYENKKKLKACR